MLQRALQGEGSHRTGGIVDLPIEWVLPPERPLRQKMSVDQLRKLMASIKQDGILHPLLVVSEGPMRYRLVCGNRRYEAAKALGLPSVPALVCQEQDPKLLQRYALTENVHRQDLNVLERTQAILNLMALEWHKSPEEIKSWLKSLDPRSKNPEVVSGIAQVSSWFEELGLGKWRSFVQNQLSLLEVPPEVEAALSAGQITASVASLLRKVKDPKTRQGLLEKAVAGASYRELQSQLRPRHQQYLKVLTRLQTDWSQLPDAARQEIQQLVAALLQ
ncbi:MAG: ParB/RepB/Spo0J family partition protein [Nanopusillaceae archaeon]